MSKRNFERFLALDRVQDISRPAWLQEDVVWDQDLYAMCPVGEEVVLFLHSLLGKSTRRKPRATGASRAMVIFRVVETHKDFLFRKSKQFEATLLKKLTELIYLFPKYEPSLRAVRDVLFPEDTVAKRIKKRRIENTPSY